MSPWNRGTAEVQSQRTAAVDTGLRSYMLKIYNYMTSALILTGLVAYFASQAAVAPGADGAMALTPFGQAIFMSPLKWVVILAPLAFIMVMSFMRTMKTSTLQLCFWAFSAVMGLSLASIFLVYTGESIARVFFISAATFGGMSILGYTTKKDLTGMGHFLIMGVWGLVVASVVNLFMQSTGLSLVISYIGVVVFTGLIAYDTQKLKEIYYQVGHSAEGIARASIMGALNLYLDFINLFMSLLRIMGDRR